MTNYFDLLGLPKSFNVDAGEVERRYLEMRQKLVITTSPEAPVASGSLEERSGQLEKAYQLLLDPEQTIEYILRLHGYNLDEDGYAPPPQFLMEVHDLNEELVQVEMDDRQEQLINVEQKVQALLHKIDQDVTETINDAEEDPFTEETLLQVRDYYLQKKYLKRILDRINGIRNIATL